MSLRTLSDIKLSIGTSEKVLVELATKKLGKKPTYFAIKKKSLDARNKSDLKYVYTIEFSNESPPKKPALERLPKNKLPKKQVAVIGSGPAGLFCALRLIERGITPLLIERGGRVEDREKDIQTFINTTTLNPQSNIQFGEGGAGTFSDGKLNTQTHSPLNCDVLKTFVRFGAPEEILWLNKPHIGSDYLKKVVKNMREYILANGGTIYFNTQMTDIKIKDGEVESVTIQSESGVRELEVSALVLAIGHSARDTFELLLKRGLKITATDFAVGVRIEHLQGAIGFSQSGASYSKLPAADLMLPLANGLLSIPLTSTICSQSGMESLKHDPRRACSSRNCPVETLEVPAGHIRDALRQYLRRDPGCHRLALQGVHPDRV